MIKNMLKTRRIELNLTMKQVAEAVGVSEGTVSRWESGEISNMKRSRIAALAKVLKIKPSDIIGVTSDVHETASEETIVKGRVLSEADKEFFEYYANMTETDKQWLLGLIKSVKGEK